MDDSILINEAKAHETAKSLRDPTTRNLVMFGIAEARMRAIRQKGQDEAHWRNSLPEQPFDMSFFTNVLTSMFSKTDVVREVLNGKDLAQASGWDI